MLPFMFIYSASIQSAVRAVFEIRNSSRVPNRKESLAAEPPLRAKYKIRELVVVVVVVSVALISKAPSMYKLNVDPLFVNEKRCQALSLNVEVELVKGLLVPSYLLARTCPALAPAV